MQNAPFLKTLKILLSKKALCKCKIFIERALTLFHITQETRTARVFQKCVRYACSYLDTPVST